MLFLELAKLSSTIFKVYISAAKLDAIAAVSNTLFSEMFFADPAVSAPMRISKSNS